MITRYASLLAQRRSIASPRPFVTSTSPRSSSSPSSDDDWVPLQSATGRARKRRRQIAARQRAAPKKEKETPVKVVSPQGWRVLWPDPYGGSSSMIESARGLPGLSDFSRAWKTYKATWAGGLRGDLPVEGEEENDNNDKTNGSPSLDADQMKKNLSKNVSAARDEAQSLKEEMSKRTGIRTQDDLKAFAKDMMTLATECLQEFMSGYRKGRDQEVDRMLNDYFQEEEEEENKQQEGGAKRKRRRKPKRAILRP